MRDRKKHIAGSFVTKQESLPCWGDLEGWYAPFGEIMTEYNPGWQSGVIPKYSFNAKELDEENGMYYYSARYYDPKGTFISRDPMFEKYFWMSPYTYCANNPVIYIDPTGMTIDPSELTAEQQETFNSTMKFACESSELFKTMYDELDQSKTVYKIRIGKTSNNTPGQYNREDNTITFRSIDDMINGGTYREELFHAFQHDNLSLYESDKSFNFEFEAKVAKFLMRDQAGLGQFGQAGTNFESMFNFLSPNGFDVNMPNSQTINGSDFQSGYMKGAESFMNWNINNNYGNSHYRTKTEQAPKSLMKLFTK